MALGGLTAAMAERCASFVVGRLARARAIAVGDVRLAAEEECEPGDRRALSIAEFGLQDRATVASEDYLVLLSLTAADGTSGPLAVITPGALRSARRTASPTSFTACDIPVATDEGANCVAIVALLAYAVRRNLRTERILGRVQEIVDVLQETSDPPRAFSLAQGILDRVEVLEDAGDAQVVVAGRAELSSGGSAPVYTALIDDRLAARPDEGWWVKGSSLHIGASVPALKRVTTGSHLLLRYGGRSTQQGVRRYIERLRRTHTLKRDQLQGDSKAESYLSYVEKELERRKTATIEALYGHHNMLPVVTPIALEVNADFGEVEAGNEIAPAFGQKVEALRLQVAQTYGVTLPGVRIRIEDDLKDVAKAYRLMVREIPVANTAGSVGVEVDEAVRRKYDSAVFLAGRIAADERVAQHLLRVVEDRLADFVGLDEISMILAVQPSTALARLGTTPGGLVRFGMMIDALLRERLPINPMSALVDRYLELVDLPTSEIAEQLRRLPHVQQVVQNRARAAWRVVRWGKRFTALLESAEDGAGDELHVELDRVTRAKMLDEIATEVAESPPGSASDGEVAILVDRWELRPLVTSLIRSRFSRVSVIAEREIAGLSPPLEVHGEIGSVRDD